MFKDGELMRVEFRARERDARQLVVRVGGGARVAGEMLAARRDALGVQRVVECAGIADDLRGVVAVAAAAE